MSYSTFFKSGDWNIIADCCGLKIKASHARKMWNGMYTCPEHWDRRQPLDLPVTVNPLAPLPFVRQPNYPPVNYPTGGVTYDGSLSYAGRAIAGSAAAGSIESTNMPTLPGG